MNQLMNEDFHLVIPRVAIRYRLSKGRYDETFAGEDGGFHTQCIGYKRWLRRAYRSLAACKSGPLSNRPTSETPFE